MALPDYLFERVTADIGQQMAGIVALADQLARQRLTPDAQACVSSVSEAADSVRRTLAAALDVDSQFGLEVALGVLLARKIVDDLGGKLTDESNLGAGCTVAFQLDLDRAAAAPAPERQGPGRSAHVLVVDDNATNRMVAQA